MDPWAPKARFFELWVAFFERSKNRRLFDGALERLKIEKSSRRASEPEVVCSGPHASGMGVVCSGPHASGTVCGSRLPGAGSRARNRLNKTRQDKYSEEDLTRSGPMSRRFFYFSISSNAYSLSL